MLENKLGISNAAELAREEERISKQKAILLFQNDLLAGRESGTFATLAFIHRCLWLILPAAGRIRVFHPLERAPTGRTKNEGHSRRRRE